MPHFILECSQSFAKLKCSITVEIRELDKKSYVKSFGGKAHAIK